MDKKRSQKGSSKSQKKSFEKRTEPVIPKVKILAETINFPDFQKEFSREIDRILDDTGFADVKFDKEATEALRVAADDFMQKFFESTAISAANGRRTVVKSEDVAVVKKHLKVIDKKPKNQ